MHRYAAFESVIAALEDMRQCRHGLVLLQGPPLSGKSTMLRVFAESLENQCAVAMVDGRGLNTTGLLEAILRQFGYEIDCSSNSELLAMLRVFCQQQTASQEAPILVLENVHELNPSALRALCELANLDLRGLSALKIVLTSSRSMQAMMQSDALACIAKRVSNDVHLRPMSAAETRQFLHTKLAAAGAGRPEDVITSFMCDELWQASGGWPGILDRIALLALAKTPSLPLSIDAVERPNLPHGTWQDTRSAPAEAPPSPPAVDEPAKLVLSNNGKVTEEIRFDRQRILIGRSDHNDISIDSKFVSRHHLLLVRHGHTTFMMDLNSTNGTYVNSRRVSNQVLIDGDIVSVGHFRIKFCDPVAASRAAQPEMEIADTAIMKTLEDMRTLLARENTALLPAQDSEQLPTYVNER
ncbi:MAG: FHA domain-containing protein [Pseudomonadota bacterium]